MGKRDRPLDGRELILKFTFSVDCTGTRPIVYPDILLFATRQTWADLAQECLKRAAPKDDDDVVIDPLQIGGDWEDHAHLRDFGLNGELCDSVDVRFGTITNGNRDKILEAWRINAETARRDSFTQWGPDLIDEAREHEHDARPYCH
jgi:hypothetical protein